MLKIKKKHTILKHIKVNMKRDFTYIDHVIDWIIKAINHETKYDILNLWNNSPIGLKYLISLLENNLWKKAKNNYLPLQPWDMFETNTDIQHTKHILWWEPRT